MFSSFLPCNIWMALLKNQNGHDFWRRSDIFCLTFLRGLESDMLSRWHYFLCMIFSFMNHNSVQTIMRVRWIVTQIYLNFRKLRLLSKQKYVLQYLIKLIGISQELRKIWKSNKCHSFLSHGWKPGKLTERYF